MTHEPRLAFIVTSNGFKDREQEHVAAAALRAYVDYSWKSGTFQSQPLLLWHEQPPIGDIIWADMEGPFLVEVARERKGRYARAAWDFMENENALQWGASHGFYFRRDWRTRDGVYRRILKCETSVLPLSAAANPYTYAGVISKMNRDQLLQQIVGAAAATRARRAKQTVKQAADALRRSGMQSKAETILDPDQALADLVAQLTPEGKLRALAAIGAILAEASLAVADEEGTEEAVADEVPPLESAMMAEDQGEELMAGMASVQRSVTEQTRAVELLTSALQGVVEQVGTLSSRLSAVEKRANMAPRQASKALETQVTDAALTESAKALAQQYTELLPGLVVKR